MNSVAGCAECLEGASVGLRETAIAAGSLTQAILSFWGEAFDRPWEEKMEEIDSERGHGYNPRRRQVTAEERMKPPGSPMVREKRNRMRKSRKIRRFTVVLERDEDGLYVASVPALKGCHTQGKTLDQVMERIREAVELWLEVHREMPAAKLPALQFVGIQELEIPA